MTPFDPAALVAMLLVFYPVVSAAAFSQARAEHPTYFAGGVIFGSKGDKLRLPDGREFDCIQAAGGPASGRHWMCSLIDPTDPGTPDPFPLEDGPLVPADEDYAIGPRVSGGLETLVADGLGGLDNTDAVLASASEAAATFTGATDIENGYASTIEPAAETHAGIRSALDGDDPSDELGAIDDHNNIIAVTEPDYTEPPPADVPEPDPGEPPPDKGGPDNPTPAP